MIALVSDLHFDLPCPQFGLDDAPGVADLLEQQFLSPAEELSPLSLNLRVDGRAVPLKPYIQRMLAGTVRGLLSALKDAQGEEIELHIKGPE
jgi:hypothetical protein